MFNSKMVVGSIFLIIIGILVPNLEFLAMIGVGYYVLWFAYSIINIIIWEIGLFINWMKNKE